MLCTRCGGLLLNSKDSMQQTQVQSTRCVNCGCVDDPVIRANRGKAQRTHLRGPRGSVGQAKVALFRKLKSIPRP